MTEPVDPNVVAKKNGTLLNDTLREDAFNYFAESANAPLNFTLEDGIDDEPLVFLDDQGNRFEVDFDFSIRRLNPLEEQSDEEV